MPKFLDLRDKIKPQVKVVYQTVVKPQSLQSEIIKVLTVIVITSAIVWGISRADDVSGTTTTDFSDTSSDLVSTTTPTPFITTTTDSTTTDTSSSTEQSTTTSVTTVTPPVDTTSASSSLLDTINNTVSDLLDSLNNSTSSILDSTSTEVLATSTASSTDTIIQTESDTDTGKLVTLDAPNESAFYPLTDVLASTTIPHIFKVGQENKIHIKWKNNGNQDVSFHAYDTDSDGYLDYVEWTVPHLSEQTFEIIFISKAFQLDQDLNIVSDIYDQTKTKDGVYASLADGQYARVTFNETLDNTKDITVYAKPTNGSCAEDNNCPSIEVYPVYTDSDGNVTEGPKLDLVSDGTNPDFSNIDHDGKYRILLKNIQTPTDVFDLRIIGVNGTTGADIDYIVDPTPSTITDNFAHTTKIADSTNLTVDTTTGTISLAAASSWTCGNTLVDSRDSKTYTTVTIGSQCWMQQNLNIGTRIAGAGNQGTSVVSSTTIQKYCYSDTEANCTSNGGLYQWGQAMGGSTTAGAQGICMAGWHVPTHDEFTTLEQTTCTANGGTTSCSTDFPLDASTTGWLGTHTEGTTLKSVSGLFRGLLAGYRYTNGTFFYSGSSAYFWSSLQSGSSAWYRDLLSSHATVYRGTDDKLDGFSVRCLEN